MSTREELDAMLFDYLRAERDDPMRARLRGITDWQLAHDKQDEERHTTVVRALDGHNFRMQSLEQKATKLEEEAEDTGEHRLEELKERLAAAETSARSRGERRWQVLLAIVGGMAALAASALAGHFGWPH